LNVDNQLVDENGVALPHPEPESDDEYPETDAEDDAYILTELERQIKQSNARTAARMVKKASGKVKIYAQKAIVSLAIPAKIWLKTEAKRLLCRITKVVAGSLKSSKIAIPSFVALVH
jgi:hypothetical protein